MTEIKNMEDVVAVTFEIITCAGSATSKYMEAVQEARDGNFDAVDKLFEEGDKLFVEAHHAHGSLIEEEGNGIQIPFCLVLLHAEDQLMRTEITKNMAETMIDLYRKLSR